MRRFLITGANSDIGLACIRRILSVGGSVLAVHRNLGVELDAIQNENKDTVELLETDFLDNSQFNKFIKLIESRKDELDSLITLAALRNDIPYRKIIKKDLLQHFEVNVIPTILLVQILGESMNNKGWGRILISSSIGVKFGGGKSSFCYSMTKYCSELIPSISKKWSQRNVLYNVLRIGFTNTSSTRKINKNLKIREQLIPMKRSAKPDEIAEMVYWLCSDENTYVTGQVLSISGGE